MKKVVLRLDVHNNEKCKKKAMKLVSTVYGVDSISMDMKEKKLTVIGDIDPVVVVNKLRKLYYTDIVSVGPAKETEKEKEEKKKDEPKIQVAEYAYQYPVHQYPTYYYYPPTIIEEHPNLCTTS